MSTKLIYPKYILAYLKQLSISFIFYLLQLYKKLHTKTSLHPTKDETNIF